MILPLIGEPQLTRISAHCIWPCLTAARNGVSPFVSFNIKENVSLLFYSFFGFSLLLFNSGY